MGGDQCQNYTAMAFTKLKHAHFLFGYAFFIWDGLFIWVWFFYLGMVFSFGYGIFHLCMVFVLFGYGLSNLVSRADL